MGGEPMAGSPPLFYVHQRVLSGGERGIRTLDTGFGPYAPLAGECLRPLGHLSDLNYVTSLRAPAKLRQGLRRSRLTAISASLARSFAGAGPPSASPRRPPAPSHCSGASP